MAVFLTISEAARALDVRESTLRSWRDAFASYVICKVEDGNRLYDLDRLRELQYVCAVWAKQRPRKSMAEVGRELARRYPLEAAAAGLALPKPVDFETLPDLTDGLPQHPYPQYEDRPHVHGPAIPPGLDTGAGDRRGLDVPLGAALHRLAALAGELGEIKEIQADQLRAQRDLQATVNGLAQILGDIRDAADVLKELPDLCRRQIEAERRAHAESEAFHADLEAFLARSASAALPPPPPRPSWRRYLSPSHWRAVWRGHLDPPAPEAAPEDRPAIPAPIGSREGP